MSQPYVGEIRMFGGNFAPAGWMFCDGQTLPISENDTLFNLIGTTYGGDGQETFQLPNLQSRVPVHPGGTLSYQLGESGGVESVTLSTQQIPTHNHPINSANNPADANVPNGNTILSNMGPSGIAQVPCYRVYDNTAPIVLNGGSVSTVGGSQPHDNMQPYLVVSYIISLFGIYPSPN
jgi:microcystin-dependent protein